MEKKNNYFPELEYIKKYKKELNELMKENSYIYHEDLDRIKEHLDYAILELEYKSKYIMDLIFGDYENTEKGKKET